MEGSTLFTDLEKLAKVDPIPPIQIDPHVTI